MGDKQPHSNSITRTTQTILIHVTLTWLATLAVLLTMYSPQVIITMSAQFMVILSIATITLSFLYFHSRANYNKFSTNLRSRTTILDKLNKPADQYKETLRHNTAVEVAWLVSSEEYKSYCAARE